MGRRGRTGPPGFVTDPNAAGGERSFVMTVIPMGEKRQGSRKKKELLMFVLGGENRRPDGIEKKILRKDRDGVKLRYPT